jgi:hypothetical protein
VYKVERRDIAIDEVNESNKEEGVEAIAEIVCDAVSTAESEEDEEEEEEEEEGVIAAVILLAKIAIDDGEGMGIQLRKKEKKRIGRKSKSISKEKIRKKEG